MMNKLLVDNDVKDDSDKRASPPLKNDISLIALLVSISLEVEIDR